MKKENNLRHRKYFSLFVKSSFVQINTGMYRLQHFHTRASACSIPLYWFVSRALALYGSFVLRLDCTLGLSYSGLSLLGRELIGLYFFVEGARNVDNTGLVFVSGYFLGDEREQIEILLFKKRGKSIGD